MTDKQKNDSCEKHICSHKRAFMLDNWIRKLFQSPGKILGEYINPGDTAIDLGCGPGFFTVEIADRVGPNGKVITVDVQEEMLEHVKKKAAGKHFSDRIQYHKCKYNSIDLELENKADFILAYYMIHETPNPGAFLEEVKTLLKKGGKFLVVEPKMHVKPEAFEDMINLAKKAGFSVLGFPRKKGGRNVLFTL